MRVFLRSTMVWKPVPFPSSGIEASNLREPLDWATVSHWTLPQQ